MMDLAYEANAHNFLFTRMEVLNAAHAPSRNELFLISFLLSKAYFLAHQHRAGVSTSAARFFGVLLRKPNQGHQFPWRCRALTLVSASAMERHRFLGATAHCIQLMSKAKLWMRRKLMVVETEPFSSTF